MIISLLVFLLAGQEPKVPDGFTIEKVAEATFPMFAGLDNQGRLYVTESSGGDLYLELQKLTRHCKIRRFTEKNGKFGTSTIFAENLTPSMGLAWRDGKLYVADPPDLVALEDTTGSGKADQRTVLLTGFGHQDNGSLHGITFGPDGLLYGTMGQPDGYTLKARDGTVLTGKSGILFRCKPDGTQCEVLCRGFENLVEIVFLPNGDILGTCNWYQKPVGGIRDAIVHLVPGGLYPYVPDKGTAYPFTGELIPPLALFPAVALSGMCRYNKLVFPEEMWGNLFTAQHNSRKVMRHVLTRSGASYVSKDLDFVTSENPDFHPSDVLVAPDGSLLVVDTGAWYVQHCPTGKIRASHAPGGIYRVRSKEDHTPSTIGIGEIWAPDAAYARRFLALDAKFARALGRWGVKEAEPELRKMLSSKDLSHQLAAAEALATCGTKESLPALWEALAETTDKFIEHQLVYAAFFLAEAGDLEKAFAQESPRVQKAALVLLDQKGGAPRDAVVRRVGAADPALRKAAIRILQNHKDWAVSAIALVQDLVRKKDLADEEKQTLRGLILTFQADESLQRAVGLALRDGTTSAGILISAMGETTLSKLPAPWIEGIGRYLPAISSIQALQALQIPDFDEKLLEIARSPVDPSKAADYRWKDTRLAALRAAIVRHPELPPELLDFVIDELGDAEWPMRRITASEIVGRARLTDEQTTRALGKTRMDALVSPGMVVSGFSSVTSANNAARLLESLAAAVRSGWHPTEQEIEAVLSRFPPEHADGVSTVRKTCRESTEDQRAKLEKFHPLLSGGDPTLGRAIFFGKKVACSACHAIGSEGGRIGPDLTKVGAIRSGRDILESILLPSSTFAQGYEPYLIATKDGNVLSGLIARQDAEVLVLKDASGAETRVRHDRIREIRRGTTSIMPEGLERNLTEAEFRNLLGFLQSLK